MMKMNKKENPVNKLMKCFLTVLFSLGFSAQAADVAPDALIKSVTDELLVIVRTDKAIQAGDMKRVTEVIEVKVLPHFDFARMASLAMGRDGRGATPAQLTEVSNEFRTLLVRTYAGALTTYRNEQITVDPLRMGAGDTKVTVQTKVRKPGAQAVSIDYDLAKAADGWKVTDVIVGGVSLVTNYRAEFGKEIRANGIDGLLKLLRTKNRAAEK